MSIRNLIILSQLNPPAQRQHVLFRQRVNELLKTSLNVPITILRAGTGYGKSTALLSFINGLDIPIYWYSISNSDRDPALFLANLFSAFNQHGASLGMEALRILESSESDLQEAMIAFVNTISLQSNGNSLLILDDFHHVREVDEIMQLVEWLVDHLPQKMHLLISTRRSLEFHSLNRWRVKESVLEINREDLAFSQTEIADLFAQHYNVSLNQDEIQQLYGKTEGWAIGLQMVWQSLRGNKKLNIRQILDDDLESRKSLFAYLAEEVLGNLQPETQEFLLKTSILSELDSDTCDFLMMSNQSINILDQLHQSGLFIEALRPGVYRYHHMFREFLQNHLQEGQPSTLELHRRVASYFSAHQYWEQALYHLLVVGDYAQVNHILEVVGEKMILEGRHESIRYWIAEMPEEVRLQHPYVNYLQGEIDRYASRFNSALEHYRAAQRLYQSKANKFGVSLALRGQAQIYLDTIRPINADQLLKDALSLLDPLEARDEVARLLTLMAENQLNLGDPESAIANLQRAVSLRNEYDVQNDFIKARILLRTGCHEEGIALLKSLESLKTPTEPARPQRFHREASLLLSLFYAFKGDLQKATHFAENGISIGENLHSNFVQSVGLMRLGHCLQLDHTLNWDNEGIQKAISHYEESIRKVDVVRIHVEPLWGMCRALGFSGKLMEAKSVAREALSIAKDAGDEWIGILIRLSLGASLYLAGEYDAAAQELSIAESNAIRVKDPFCACAARLWLAKNAHQQGYENSMLMYLEKLLPIVRELNYQYLVTHATLLGSDQPADFIPLLLAAKEKNIETALVNDLLGQFGLEGINYHPGYTLSIRMLGGFIVKRGRQLISNKDWKREKAKLLLQLLAANWGKWLTREQLAVYLWPDVDASTAANNFKVTLNALNQVLEPDRPRGEAPFFILKRGEQYSLNCNAGIFIDVNLFEALIQAEDIQSNQKAAELYKGHYLENELAQEWFVAEDQYYCQKHLVLMDKLIDYAIENKDLDKALALCATLISQDKFNEGAYRRQMQIYHQLGNDQLVHLVFQQCQQNIQQESGREITSETIELYETLINESTMAR